MQAASIRLTPRQVALVQESFAKIAPIREQAAALFYNRLFVAEVRRHLFTTAQAKLQTRSGTRRLTPQCAISTCRSTTPLPSPNKSTSEVPDRAAMLFPSRARQRGARSDADY